MSNKGTQRVEITRKNRRKLAERIGDNVDTEEIKNEIRRTRKEIKSEIISLQKEVNQLRDRIGKIEREKAVAKQSAMENRIRTLEEQVKEKREKWEKRIGQVLDDYRESIKRLKDRFISSISGRQGNFGDVESEFEQVTAARKECVAAIDRVSEAAVNDYQRRSTYVRRAGTECVEAIDDFLQDREKTARTIDSLQTDLPGVSGSERIKIPFWVVGIERNGTQEVRVLPIQNRFYPSESPTRAAPYVNNLSDHQTHDYSDMVDIVHDHVSQDEVWEALADHEITFADPSYLRRRDTVMDRFVDALQEFELKDRSTTGRSRTGGEQSSRSTAGPRDQTDPETVEVTNDD